MLALAKDESLSKHSSSVMDVFSDLMLKYMHRNEEDIKFVGEGSSRIVFIMADGTALKVAYNDAGIS